MSEYPSRQPYLRRLFDGRTHELKDGHSIIGRSDDCSILLNEEPGLSRKHARITVDDNRIILFDLGSLNGTLVNGSEAIDKLVLHHGDIIVFDEVEYELLVPERTSNDESPVSEKDTVVANLHEREDLIKSEVRVVDDAFLMRDRSSRQEDTVDVLDTDARDAEDSVVASIGQPTFIIRGTGAAGVRIPLDTHQSAWTIGSSTDQEVFIAHPSIADRHAILGVENGRWTLTDCGSTDGLLVNGRRIDSQIITSGDVIRIGKIECLFVCPREYSETEVSRALPRARTPETPQQSPPDQTFDTSDMTPVGWRDTRQKVPWRRSRLFALITSLTTLFAIVAAYFYWR